jgi:hypothetical protein
MRSATVMGFMKSIRHLILKVTRKSRPLCQQMELSLPGSQMTRDEVDFVRRIRQLRERLEATRT